MSPVASETPVLRAPASPWAHALGTTSTSAGSVRRARSSSASLLSTTTTICWARRRWLLTDATADNSESHRSSVKAQITTLTVGVTRPAIFVGARNGATTWRGVLGTCVRTPSVTRRAAKSVPVTKRSMGPNVPAAPNPEKNRPGDDDSNVDDRRGNPRVVATEAATAGSSSESLATS